MSNDTGIRMLNLILRVGIVIKYIVPREKECFTILTSLM